MPTPKVSLIMPNYNYAPYLKEAIEGVLNQTYENFELILIDDASTDNSLDIIQSYTKKDSRIQLIIHEKNKGFYASILDGLNASKGEYVTFPSSDDLLFPTFLEKKVIALDTHPDVGLAFSKFATFEKEGLKSHKTIWCYKSEKAEKLSQRELMHHIKMHRLWIPGNTILCRKELFIKEGGYDPRFLSYTDWYVFLKMGFRYQAYYIPETLAALRVHSSSLSATENYEKKHKAWNEIITDLSKRKNKDLKKAFIRSHVFNTLNWPFFDFILKNPRYWIFFKLYVYKHFSKRWKKSKKMSGVNA